MTYTYKCEACSHEFEIDQRIKDDPGSTCPNCKVFTRNRLINTGTTFVLKGSGWAADNYSKHS